MRIVAGSARSRRLSAPAGDDVRPTSDRVREATFAALGSRGAIVGATVLDLFAGSGALGLEALSRGAAHCVFVDSSRRAVESIRTNIEVCGFGDRSEVVHASAESYLGPDASFDLALLDPPYAFDDWANLLAGIPAKWVVVESDRSVAGEVIGGRGIADAEVQREARYGSTVVSLIRFAGRGPHRVPTSEDAT